MRRQPLCVELRDPRCEGCGPHTRFGGRVVLRRHARLPAARGRMYRACRPPPLQQRRPRLPPRGVGDELGGGGPLRAGFGPLGWALRSCVADEGRAGRGPGARGDVRGLRRRALLGAPTYDHAVVRGGPPKQKGGGGAQLAAAPIPAEHAELRSARVDHIERGVEGLGRALGEGLGGLGRGGRHPPRGHQGERVAVVIAEGCVGRCEAGGRVCSAAAIRDANRRGFDARVRELELGIAASLPAGLEPVQRSVGAMHHRAR
mmetsp:Transcript_93964/g.271608  ORF Transcript_93964/g.271608 Transcript_93964/m.271608 type:complete len:260 (+) Transcript_93964:724-1503(+)